MKEQELKIFTGNANPELAKEICQYLGCRLGEATVEAFPDGETFVRIDENIRGRDVFLIQPTCNPANQHLMELLIMVDAARRASANRITVVLPFFGYARQDRKDQPRVPITAKLVANLIAAAGANRVLTMDLHAQQIQGFFDLPVDHLYASPVFSDYLQKLKLESDLVVYSPDVGGMKMAAAYAAILKTPLGFVAKKRVSATEVEAFNLVGDVEGKDVLLIDDMTETAGTLTAAAELLKENGAKSVRAAVTHGVLNEKGYKRLQKGVIDELITTNTTPVDPRGLPITVLSVAELLGKAIMHIHSNESVSGLFEIKGF
ncbi:ribose-phosphate diphosphokinase [Cerasicoccus arenae]|nr:ribose-phosphate pyrophosphokinase [Cerasicoccus arenae]MBK1859838.1 ribose-phosphate pyrophosphokinase [Cerasicoccus arenae]